MRRNYYRALVSRRDVKAVPQANAKPRGRNATAVGDIRIELGLNGVPSMRAVKIRVQENDKSLLTGRDVLWVSG